jgi:hypothetical protein
MKKIILLLAAITIGYANANAQSCLPQGITFTTQEQIDNFQTNYPGCTEIEGDVKIGICNVTGNITNLNGLSVLTSIGGYLTIYCNKFLTSLTGLENLTSIGDYLGIRSNNALTSLTGLENLTSIGDYLEIRSNNALTSLTGLENLTFIGDYLEISSNNALTSLTGLENITSIGDYFFGFGWGNLKITHNQSLTNMTGLEGLASIGGDFIIYGNDSLISLTGLEGLTEIHGNVEIGHWTGMGIIIGNPMLTSLTGLDNLTNIGGNLSMYWNPALASLTGLDNLTSIGGNLFIAANDALTSLTGLDNIDAGSITDLTIGNNSSLSICEIQSICDYLAAPNGTVTISDNATGCNSQAQVIAACATVGVEETITESGFSIYPNPFTGQLNIEFNLPQTSNVSIQIFNAMGAKVAELHHGQLPAGQQQFTWHAGHLPKGLYFSRVQAWNETHTQKIIKVQ